GSAKLLSKVFLVQDADHPCPPCVGDTTPNDGVKDGTCNGGKTPGVPCDVGGISDLFDAAGPDFGHTSNDCLPTGSSVGELNIARTGTCGTQQGELVAFFCIPQTRAAAINTTAGLPGPGAVTIPARQVRTPR